MDGRKRFFNFSFSRREVVVSPDIVLDHLPLEHNRRMSFVANKLTRSDEFSVADRSGLEWFLHNPDDAYAKYGRLRRFQRIVFLGSEGALGFETLKFDQDGRGGKGEFMLGKSIPRDFVWNSTLGLAALHPKTERGD